MAKISELWGSSLEAHASTYFLRFHRTRIYLRSGPPASRSPHLEAFSGVKWGLG